MPLNITVISRNYPSDRNPTEGTFVYDLVQEFVRQGAQVTTIAPQNVWSMKLRATQGYGTELSKVVRPSYVSFSNITIRPGLTTHRLGVAAFARAVRKMGISLPRADVIYSHFLYPSGVAALRLGEDTGVPVVVALGESRIERVEAEFGIKAIRRNLQRFARIITVSEALKRYCVDRGQIVPDKVVVVPNAVDHSLFYPRDRRRIREKLRLPQTHLIVAFVGHFDERKGVRRLLAALKAHPHIKAVLIGSGPDWPRGEQVLFAGRVNHDKVPEWLGASDIFCLPTLAEGNCNAVNEALAMGLPVISSDISAIREQVPKEAGILVDPQSVEQISSAIGVLARDQELRLRMSDAALSVARARTLQRRADVLLNVLCDVVTETRGGGIKRSHRRS